MRDPSIITHLRDIIILPFTVTVIVPHLIYNSEKIYAHHHTVIKMLRIAFFIAGFSLFVYTVYLFKTFGKGTLAPWTPTQKLVIRGPYKYCRNPMITGVLTILFAEALYFNSMNILIWMFSFFLINTAYFILIEEPLLSERFGDDYHQYKKNVPRWLPRLTPYSGNRDSQDGAE